VMIPAFYVSIDINPSLEFGVNRLGRVVDVKFYNDDSARLVEDKNIFKNKPLEDAVRIFIDRAKMGKYLDGENPAVMFTISRRDRGKNTEKIKEALKNAVKEAANREIRASEGSVKMLVQSSPLTMAQDTSKDTKDVEIIIEEVSIKKHDDARKMGISPGKLYIYEKIKEKNPGITLEEVKNKPIKNLLKEIKNENKEILEGEKFQKKVDEKDIEKDKNENKDEKENTEGKNSGGTKKVLEMNTSGQEKEIPIDKKDDIKENLIRKINLKERFNNKIDENLIEEKNKKGFLKNIFEKR
ncbi:anti-sigma-I factor RsgI family protein, partial [Thermovenabulum sp.]|uniref:anti-sigma-I factor RsgI family protein n=1 Tax=Thermovenabulum sp. TaxID=3100335 RepID=UPI003C7EA863